MQCPKCQFETPEGSAFCGNCGAPLAISCPKCGSTPPLGFNFCNRCGHDLHKSSDDIHVNLSFEQKIKKVHKHLPKSLADKILSQKDKIEGEQKQVTVMFCDMEGFTPMTEFLGIEETYSIMDQVYDILIHKVHEYEGTVNEMTGDGIMALFGAPVALEDAPMRAIRSSLAIHREMAKLSGRLRQDKKDAPAIKMRIGIHSGQVVVGTIGNDLCFEFKAVGDTVNLASRMEGLAQPGTTYISEDVFRLTEGLFRFESLGQQVIKGKKNPVSVYRVIAPSSRRTRFDVSADRGLTPYVGKERELGLLLDGLERSKAGRGQAFSIMAEAGLGKSRLLYEFRKAIAHEDVTFLEGKCLSYSKGAPYHLHIDTLKANFDIREGDSDSEIKKKVKKGIKIIKADADLAIPSFLELLSVKQSDVENLTTSPEEKRRRIIKALKQIILKGSEIRPLILVYEDLHWVDKSSEEVLKHILDIIPGVRILLIFTYRPEFIHYWGAKSYHNQIILNRLSNRESLLMVSHLLGTEDLDGYLEEFILEKTEGIPFFIEELIKSLERLKIIERRNDKCRITTNIKTVTIPATIQDVIMSRIDSLHEEIKNLIQTASVVGREFNHQLIKKVTEYDEQDLLSHLSTLKDLELIYERGVYPKSTYIFKHALTQEATYNSLLLKKRKDIHKKIGEAIESLYPDRLEEHYELLAYHFALSFNTEKAVEYLKQANNKAIRINAMEEAKAYFDKAMEFLDTMPENDDNRQQRIFLLVSQCEVFYVLFKTSEYYNLLSHYEPMAIELGDQALLGALYSRMGNCEHSIGEFDKAIKTSTKAVELCEAGGNIEDAGYAYAWLGWHHLYRGHFEQVFVVKEKLLRVMQQQFNIGWYVRGLCVTSRANMYLGRWEEAVEDAKKALKIAEEASDSSYVVFAIWTLSMAYTWRGDLGQGVKYGELALQNAVTPADFAWAQRGLGWALCRAGETKRGIALLISALENFKSGNHMAGIIPTTCTLGEGYWLAGEVDKGEQKLEEGLKMAKHFGTRYFIGFAQRLLGEINLKGKPDQATLCFKKSIAILQDINAENELAIAYAGYGRLLKHQNKIIQARDYQIKALEIFKRLGTLLEPDRVMETLVDLPQA